MTTYPPTTFIGGEDGRDEQQHVAHCGVDGSRQAIITPTTTTPWMALEPDISGVCRVAGTLVMTSKPTSRLSTKTVMSAKQQQVSSTVSPSVGLSDAWPVGVDDAPSGDQTPAVISSPASSTTRSVAAIRWASSAAMLRA